MIGRSLFTLLAYLALSGPAIAFPFHPPSSSEIEDSNIEKRGLVAGWTSLGCVVDAHTRVLSESFKTTKSMTTEYCLTYCAQKGFTYAGTEDSSQCWCGNSIPQGLGTSAAGCNAACGGNANEICGGPWRLSFYFHQVYKQSKVSTSSSAKSSSSSSTIKTSSSSTTKTSSSTTTIKTTSTTTTTTKTVPTTTTTKTPSPTTTTTTTTRSTPTTTTTTTTTSTPSPSPLPANPAGANSVFGVANPPGSNSQKSLYVHHIVGNTYSYSVSDWMNDMSQASAAGIDGFALNFGNLYWEFTQMDNAYAAANQLGGNFKLFLSIDFSANSCSGASDADFLTSLVQKYAYNNAQATYNGKPMYASFSGSGCNFGQDNFNDGFNYFDQLLSNKGVQGFFVPSIFVDPSQYSGFNWMNGELNWNSGWPMGDSPLDTSSDNQYMGDLGGKAYMPAISPFFFTYYGPNSYNKDWIYRSDDWLLARRFEQIVQMRNQVDFAEIISWNDFGESHYVGPIRQVSTPWSVSMPHTPLLPLINYYSSAFKYGSYPSINTDQIFLWSRPHSKWAQPYAPTLSKPNNWQNTDDNLYVVMLLSQPAVVTIYSGSNKAMWNAPAGVAKLSVPSLPGSIGASIARNGATVKSYDSTGQFSYTSNPADYNFNYFVANA
ncbi:glycosyl hydrolase family 71-domain-containing protein [Kockovaella imperatae]|uniref:Glycosyl hydrolase family 71-domain-containing protein n=1 Tax=Kockovaella imperatae TaxID=4999 RepID=A0A1Y1UN65_9TREE|nr:glycosyl hydrolase family 71-domain-containing protein [Kockovaella imperatae]ORX38896.1 glycosyl hydrolase family 71-domain-containing protein [Kockovaella imperatae]